jgi:putative transcriptional regulator
MRPWTRIAAVFLIALLAVIGTTSDAARQPDEAPRAGSLAGQFLVATPELEDPNFDHTVVYLISHDDSGAMGLVINRVVAKGPLNRLLEDLGVESEAADSEEVRIHYGGPVDPSRAFVLHSSDYRSEDTVPLAGGIAMTGSLDVLEDIAAGQGPQRRLLAVGYAGWAPDQLEQEVAAGAWFTVPADEALLFDDRVETKWQRAMQRRGVDL